MKFAAAELIANCGMLGVWRSSIPEHRKIAKQLNEQLNFSYVKSTELYIYIPIQLISVSKSMTSQKQYKEQLGKKGNQMYEHIDLYNQILQNRTANTQ